MNPLQVLMPLLVLLTSLLAAPIIFLLPDESRRARTTINLAAAIIKLVLVSGMFLGVYLGVTFEIAFTVVGDLEFILRVDGLGLMFAGLSSLLWLFTTIYAVGYLEDSSNRSRFFGFFSICVASTLGIAMAGNLFTFILFYELLTLSTYPLVVHRGTPSVLAAGNRYLQYTLTGGTVLLLGIVALHALAAGQVTFGDHGRLAALGETARPHLMIIFAVLIAGLAVKAAMVPLHGWLPVAMVAPAPVSALLHAVAVVKAGAFGIIRVVYDVYGLNLAQSLGLLYPLTIAAAITILYGSARALTQISIKRRLAFSTVSQVSYIIIGVSLFHPIGVAAGLVHLIHQGLMKVTLFFCAGNYAQTLGIHNVDELDGTGRRMPLTSLCFTVAAFGMIGMPPVAGFITKWYLGMGAAGAGTYWVIAVLAISGMLNAAYYLPMLYRIWFKQRKADWPDERDFAPLETSAWLLYPTLATAFLSIAAGLLAGLPFSPARWAARIALGGFLP
jgi:multicomponent Na+:H+ antiporter subunit D